MKNGGRMKKSVDNIKLKIRNDAIFREHYEKLLKMTERELSKFAKANGTTANTVKVYMKARSFKENNEKIYKSLKKKFKEKKINKLKLNPNLLAKYMDNIIYLNQVRKINLESRSTSMGQEFIVHRRRS